MGLVRIGYGKKRASSGSCFFKGEPAGKGAWVEMKRARVWYTMPKGDSAAKP
jgi:hypothetical protein